MAYDSARGVSVMFGGNFSGPDDSSTWEWNGTAWSEHAAAGPRPVYDHAMAYDPVRRVTVLFGGRLGPSYGDTWEWDGSIWTQRQVTGPGPRYGHSMAYVPTLQAIVLYGGMRRDFGSDLYFDDTWMWNGETWTQLVVAGPLPRVEHAMAFDQRKQRLLLVGGSPDRASSPSDFGDTWELAVYDTLSITRGPTSATAVSARPVSFTAEVSGGGTITYQWKKDGVALIDDGRIVGSGTGTLTIIAAQRGDAGTYTLEVTNACGHDESVPALLTITCRADLDRDGTVDFADYLAFLSGFDAQDPEADLTLDGIVDFADYLDFLNAYEEGC
ncbi:MAG: immunoglobulin domain-containing protein [Phycisphaerales bacterium]|nr:immunoglobulin domain-containing protein [Phycisphaerales bacterium]